MQSGIKYPGFDFKAHQDNPNAHHPSDAYGTNPHYIAFTIWNPNAVQSDDNEVCIWKAVDAAITISRLEVTLNPKAELTGTGIAFVDGGGGADTITDTGSGFVTAGFEDGDEITVVGSTSNDGTYTVVTVAAGTLTLATGVLTAEVAGDTVTISAPAPDMAGDLIWADAFIGKAGATVINDFDTTSGVRDDSTITNGSVAAGKCLYLSFDSAPNSAITQMNVVITFSYD